METNTPVFHRKFESKDAGRHDVSHHLEADSHRAAAFTASLRTGQKMDE